MSTLSSRYRPQTFADVTGQHPITETLRREIETGKLAHAYLFAGPRGVGKTTTARIFAKALNCQNPQQGEPDNSCDSCTEISNGRALDVIEMDAASHTGVDNVREAIIEHVRYSSQRAHKIYILDEAHMFSGSAWNALLKTIEEPPPYAVFLFLTTELHKVPATIQSRCQRFDFKRIENEPLTARIKNVAAREEVQLDPEAVKMIVGKSDGCLRDAETFLGQLLALGEKQITHDIASLILPVSRLPIAADLLVAWSRRELEPALSHIETLEADGISFLPLFDDLLAAVRLLLIASDSVRTRQKLAEGDEGAKKLATLVTAYEAPELSEMALMLMERRKDAKQGADAKFCLELAATAVCLSLLPHSVARTVVSTTPRAVSIAPPLLSSIQSSWQTFLKLIDERSTSLTFILKLARPIALDGSKLMIEFAYQFHKDKILSDRKTCAIVVAALRQATGMAQIEIDGVVTEQRETTPHAQPQDMVSTILNTFDGHVVEEEK